MYILFVDVRKKTPLDHKDFDNIISNWIRTWKLKPGNPCCVYLLKSFHISDIFKWLPFGPTSFSMYNYYFLGAES